MSLDGGRRSGDRRLDTDLSGGRCLDVSGRLAPQDRRTRRTFPFEVPRRAASLLIKFDYQPGDVAGVRNLLTLSVFDPRRFRGAAHRWATSQRIEVGDTGATPGFLAGPLPAGNWQIELDAHEIVSAGGTSDWCEFRLEVVVLLDPEGSLGPSRVESQSRGFRGTRRGGPGWYRGDLHSHSVHSDGQDTLAEMAHSAAAIGLDFRAATDHNTTSQTAELETWSGSPLQIRGIECTTFFGHVNVLGAADWIDWRIESAVTGARSIFDQAAAQGALTVAAHPRDRGNPSCTGCRWEYPTAELRRVDAIEVWNAGWLDPGNGNPEALDMWTDQLMAGNETVAVAGTDTHRISEYERTDLPYNWVHADGLGEREILDAIRLGRVYLSSGPKLGFVAETADGSRATLPGDRLPAGTIQVRVDVAELATQASVALVVDGESQLIGEMAPPGGSLTAGASAQSWWRLELRARDEDSTLLSLTNPVWHSQRRMPG
jgi:hypothetical protein